MIKNTDVENLNGILNSEIKVYRNLLDVILAEYELLVERNYEAIHEQLKVKTRLYSEITELERLRINLVSGIAADTGEEINSISDLLNFVPDAKARMDLAAGRDVLRMLVARIAEANNANSEFIDHSRRLFGSVIGNLRELVVNRDRTGVYSSKGKIDENKSQKGSLLINKGV